MTLYRSHREFLDDAMKTVVEVNSLKDLRAHLANTCPYADVRSDNVLVEKYGRDIDERIGWNTHIVTINGQVVGFTDGPLPIEGVVVTSG